MARAGGASSSSLAPPLASASCLPWLSCPHQDEVCHAATVARRHAVHLIHDQAQLRGGDGWKAHGKVQNCRPTAAVDSATKAARLVGPQAVEGRQGRRRAVQCHAGDRGRVHSTRSALRQPRRKGGSTPRGQSQTSSMAAAVPAHLLAPPLLVVRHRPVGGQLLDSVGQLATHALEHRRVALAARVGGVNLQRGRGRGMRGIKRVHSAEAAFWRQPQERKDASIDNTDRHPPLGLSRACKQRGSTAGAAAHLHRLIAQLPAHDEGGRGLADAGRPAQQHGLFLQALVSVTLAPAGAAGAAGGRG